MTAQLRSYLPAAGRDWLLPFYDPLVKLLGADRLRQKLLDQAAVRTGQRVLDIGCGTGSFAVYVKQLHPGVTVVGLDPDPKALARAAQKAERAKLAIEFTQGFSEELAFPDTHFDHIFSTFMFHHLSKEAKVKTLAEVRRVLMPGGAFHMADFAGRDARGGLLTRLIHSHEQMSDNVEKRILARMREAGLVEPQRTGTDKMLFLRLLYFQAFAPVA
jgi:ubiquinone/menaquinone biosynthesis C-methylase UbiE